MSKQTINFYLNKQKKLEKKERKERTRPCSCHCGKNKNLLHKQVAFHVTKRVKYFPFLFENVI